MKRTAIAFVAIAGIAVACAPASNQPGSAAPTSQQSLPPGHPPTKAPGQAPQAAAISFADIKKADATVAEIYADKDKLAGKPLNVRGKVVKFSRQIMGRNWVHVQDGTGSAGSNDLTVTTADVVKLGDTVLVSGALTLDKDFGGGYKYGVIIENGKIQVEP